MTFGSPHWFWALLGLPFLVLFFVRAERRSARRLRDFVSPRLLPELAGKVDRRRRVFRFGLQLCGLALAVVSLAQPRWGYSFEEAHRRGIDLLLAIDTSRSMLSNDVQPNRLERVKLATQDLINEQQGDRVGMIAFAGRAFVQAPLTIDYGAVVEAINDLNTQTIPEGGTNISEAIALAEKTFGKGASGNRALVIFTDGEELSGDALKAAKAAADEGTRIFTVGIGTPQGSLIPIKGDEAGTAFVKDSKGQVVKSKLDEKRLQEIAQTAGGFYLHLENGPSTMQRLLTEGIGKMNTGDIDVRTSRRPIERYEWPLGTAIALLAASLLVGDRKRERRVERSWWRGGKAIGATAIFCVMVLPAASSLAAAPGLDAYRGGQFDDAYGQFQDTLKTHPKTSAAEILNFDSGAAAYKMKDYGKALEAFSQALLSPDKSLQGKSHYNLGNTLYERGEAEKADEKKLANWTNALQHYDQTLKLDPQNKEAKDNYEFVKKKIDELKAKQQSAPTPTPSPPPKQDKKNNEKSESKDQSQQQQKQDQQQSPDKEKDQKQSKGGSGSNQDQKDQSGKDQSQAKNGPQDKDKNQSPKPGETPSPSPGSEQPSPSDSASPSPAAGQSPKDSEKGEGDSSPSPTPGENGSGSPSPSPSPSEAPGEGEGEEGSPSPGPSASPNKKFAGDLKGSADKKGEHPPAKAEPSEAEPEKEGEMSERQAQALLESMRDEEARVQLDERRAARRVYNDW